MKYDELMDPECVLLSDAINMIPGLLTTGSCCGHGKQGMFIYFNLDRVNDMFVLVRCLDPRYGAPVGWRCCVQDTDLPERRLAFHVESTSVGEQAYVESKRIAELIREFLRSDSLMAYWGIEKRKRMPVLEPEAMLRVHYLPSGSERSVCGRGHTAKRGLAAVSSALMSRVTCRKCIGYLQKAGNLPLPSVGETVGKDGLLKLRVVKVTNRPKGECHYVAGRQTFSWVVDSQRHRQEDFCGNSRRFVGQNGMAIESYCQPGYSDSEGCITVRGNAPERDGHEVEMAVSWWPLLAGVVEEYVEAMSV